MKISQDLRLKAGNTGLHWDRLGATNFFCFLLIFWIWSQTVTSCDELVTTLFSPQVARDDYHSWGFQFFSGLVEVVSRWASWGFSPFDKMSALYGPKIE